MGTGRWLTLVDAAVVLKATVAAVRKRAKRHSLQASRDNHGRLLVWVDTGVDGGGADGVPVQSGHGVPAARQECGPISTGASESVPLPAHRETVEALQAAHQAVAAALHAQIERLAGDIAEARVRVDRQLSELAAQHRADMAETIARHEADVVHRLAERDTLHLDTLGRLQAQTTAERSLWLERIDAAEIRAEQVEQRLDQVLDMLLTERRRTVVPEVSHMDREPWWRRWFGESRQTVLGGG